jgi:hypothetical protein
VATPTEVATPTVLVETPTVCEVDVGITCQTFDGTECNEFFVPTLQCESELSTVRFRYTGGDCSTSDNAQGDAVCIDSNEGPPADVGVLVSCSDGDVSLTQTLVSPGETVEVSASTDLLPETLVCSVTSEDETIIYQELEFSTQASFSAKNSFGSLEVEQCDDLDCIVDVTYSYTTTNAGEAPISITSLIRDRDGDVVDLTDQVDPKDLDVGESTVVEEPDQVDYCVASSITTSIDVSTDGGQCTVNPVRRGMLRHLSEQVFAEYVLSIDIQ